MPPSPPVADAALADRGMRRELGFGGLTAIGFSNIVGSGWLFGAMYAAQIAGPASLVAWVAAGVLCMLVALVMVELSATHPESGGTVRWPLLTGGPLVGSVVGVSVLLTVGGTAAEITAILQYADHYLPWLYGGDNLSVRGVVVAMALAVVLSALNWYGVRLFGRLNNLLTVVKIVVPLLTVAALFASGFHSGRLTSHGGFAPYGYGGVVTALASGGIVYSVNGFQAAADFGGEARNPRRDLPRAIIAGISLAVLMYLLLQAAFLFAVPEARLVHGWKGVSFTSPFGELALILGLHWVSLLLYADAVVSPGGSAYVGVAIDARHTHALAKNRVLPRSFLAVERRSGIPRRAIALNLLVILAFLLPFSGWQQVVSVVGDLYLITYAAVAISAAVFAVPGESAGWVRGVRYLAPASFVVASLFVYWSGWDDLRIALPLTLLGAPLYFLIWRSEPARVVWQHAARGAWVVLYLVAILVVSWIGSFGGTSTLGTPWDSVVLAVGSALVYVLAVRSGRAHVAASRAPATAAATSL
jgi:amino acid transporter